MIGRRIIFSGDSELKEEKGTVIDKVRVKVTDIPFAIDCYLVICKNYEVIKVFPNEIKKIIN